MYQNQSPLHGQLIGRLLHELANSRGHSILAASYPGFNEPFKCGRHEPDVISVDTTGLQHISEVKTGDDLNTEHTREQLWDFANRVMKNDGRSVPFIVLIPAAYQQKLREVLNELGLLNKDNVVVWTA